MTETAVAVRSIGIDAGGTQISFMHDASDKAAQLATSSFGSLDEIVQEIVRLTGTPEVLVIGAAGVISPDNSVQLTNCEHWPVFRPSSAQEQLGCQVRVVNDMVIKAAGLPEATVLTLHHGKTSPDSRKTVVIDSTGVNHATLLPDGTVFSTEGGHTTWQPGTELEDAVLRQLRRHWSYRYFSVEQLIGGRHFFKLFDALAGCGHSLTGEHRAYVELCRRSNADIGPFITSAAMMGEPFCRQFVEIIGSVLGQYLRNVALTTEPRGGIYLTGGVMQPAVVRYLLDSTSLREAYLGGSKHNSWLAEIPWQLVTDRHLGAKGALALAQR